MQSGYGNLFLRRRPLRDGADPFDFLRAGRSFNLFVRAGASAALWLPRGSSGAAATLTKIKIGISVVRARVHGVGGSAAGKRDGKACAHKKQEESRRWAAARRQAGVDRSGRVGSGGAHAATRGLWAHQEKRTQIRWGEVGGV